MRRMTPDEIRKRILCEDQEILVFHKPAGLPVQSASSGIMDLENLLRAYLGGELPRVVHRLDQPVEGIVVFGKTARAAGELSRQLASGEMRKIYLAAVCPSPETVLPPPGEVRVLEDVLIRDGRTNTSRPALAGEPGGKSAALQYEVLGRPGVGETTWPDSWIVRIKLLTGRHHQIRVQFSHAGMPLAGDSKYGGPRMREGLALCACSLTFHHPRGGREMHFEISAENPLLHL